MLTTSNTPPYSHQKHTRHSEVAHCNNGGKAVLPDCSHDSSLSHPNNNLKPPPIVSGREVASAAPLALPHALQLSRLKDPTACFLLEVIVIQ